MRRTCWEKSWKQAVNSRMRRFVTGSAGSISSHPVHRFRETERNLWGHDNLSTGHRSPGADDSLRVGDAPEDRTPNDVLSANGFEAVVHFAGVAFVAKSTSDALPQMAQPIAGDAATLLSNNRHPREMLGPQPRRSSRDSRVASRWVIPSRHLVVDHEPPSRQFLFLGSSDNRCSA